MLACIWGGSRYAWGSPTILGLLGAAVRLGGALVARERRAADPIVPLALLRTRTVAVASAALFLATAALFAINVFVPLFLQTTTGATPTEAGLLLVPAMLGITLSTNLAGRAIARTGRYKRYPVAGLALMTVALALLAVVAGDPSRIDHRHRPRPLRARLRDGRPGADRRRAERHRAPAARRRHGHDELLPRPGRRRRRGRARRHLRRPRRWQRSRRRGRRPLGAAARADVIDGVQTVFLVAAPIAAVALLLVLLLREVPLQGPGGGERPAEATPGTTAPRPVAQARG